VARRDRRTCLIIGLCCLLIYNANGRTIGAGDTFPARYLPFAIWGSHTVLLDPIATIAAQGRDRTPYRGMPPAGRAYWMVATPGGHVMSLYSVVLPVLISPLYLPAIVYLQVQGWTDARVDHIARVMEKLSASIIAAVSACLMYVLLRRRAMPSIALLLTIAYAFGTTTWVIGSQALWQHGMGELLVIGTLLLLTAPCTVRNALTAGLLCGLIAGNRPADGILAAMLGAYGLWWAGWWSRRAALFAIAAALPVMLVLLYNLGVAGHVAGGYGLVGDVSFFQHDPIAGLGGLLFSPTRGLFVFSPFLLFLFAAWRYLPPPRDRADRAERALTFAVSAAIVVQILMYATTDWRAGTAYGPRFLTDLLPLLIWMLVPVVAALRGVSRAGFVAAVAIAIVIQGVGAFCYTGATDAVLFAASASGPGRSGSDQMRAAWNWRNAPFVASIEQGLAPAELPIVMRGSLDAIEADGVATSMITAGQEIEATGWALAGRATPARVAIMMDGLPVGGSRSFHDRADVRETLPHASAAGWRVPLSTAGLAPGDHQVAVYAWASDKGSGYYLSQRTLTVRKKDEDLDESARKAAAQIRAHQQAPGYWLTAYTSATRFEQSKPEMNTFLTALLIDLLDPLAARADFGDALQRARQHLTAQIEADGLVRYHGRPDAPTIGTLGCAITPDADDTALVWRIAPDRDSQSQRLPAALATLAEYRTSDGLYRTWLAPREKYQCIDPGKDPNPTDIAIQMHTLQLLARLQLPAARALCRTLRQTIDQDRIWVYYRLAPLIPILRLNDLARAGCPLELPESRIRTSVPGQEIWITLVELLGRAQSRGGAAADAKRIDTILRQLAAGDFALLRKNPPLLYHNDLTATTSRYYWSEDVGYALWLRLAYAHAQLGDTSRDGQNR
jgi:hypothetical protein